VKKNTPMWFFYISLAFHVGVYWILVFSYYLRESGLLNSYVVDFYQNYMEGVAKYLVDPSTLYYEPDLTGINVWTFRNLPASIYYYIPFYFITSQGNLNLLIYSSVTFAWNIGSCAIIFKISSTPRWKEMATSTRFNNPWLMMSLYLLCPLHIGEYGLGQTNVIAGFFIILGFYFYLNGKEPYCYTCLSLSIYFKLIGLFLLFLMFFTSKKSNIWKSLFHVLLVQGPNIVLFLSYPNYVVDFIILNISTGEMDALLGYRGWGTGSTGTLSVFFNHNFGFSLTFGTLISLGVLIPLTLMTFWKHRSALTDADIWMVLLLLFAITIPIFYLVHVFLYLGIFIYWLATNDGKIGKISKILMIMPTFSISFWFFIPFISFIYLFPFIRLIIKAWSKDAQKQEMIAQPPSRNC
jgi:hypothetical protein